MAKKPQSIFEPKSQGFTFPHGFRYAPELADETTRMMEQYQIEGVILLLVGIAGIEKESDRMECLNFVLERIFLHRSESEKALKSFIDDAIREVQSNG